MRLNIVIKQKARCAIHRRYYYGFSGELINAMSDKSPDPQGIIVEYIAI